MENRPQNETKRVPVSIIILTYNEEENIEHTLESLKDWIGEIIIVDSYSTDETLEICKKYTDKIYQHPFENQAKQFNWALGKIPTAYDWVMRLDSDEMVTKELAMEIPEVLPTLPDDVTGIYMKRRVYFMGRWMKHGDYYPMWFLRIFRKSKGRYEEITEEHIVLSEGRTIRLKNGFIDYNRKGLTFWVDKHNNWSIGEMLDTMAAMGEAKLPEGTVKPCLFGTQEQRKRWLKKNIYARAPLFLRAFLYFFYRYIIRLGFLDGKEGLIFHFMQGFWYRFLIDAKIYEARKFGLQMSQTKHEYTGTKPWD
jgi:glycosyltransferase involved in cell wall biosynthesis